MIRPHPLGQPPTPQQRARRQLDHQALATFFEAGPACDIADDTGQALPPFGSGGIQPFVNNGVTEGDYNLFFAIYFDGCAL
jgi:hypothetical protein